MYYKDNTFIIYVENSDTDHTRLQIRLLSDPIVIQLYIINLTKRWKHTILSHNHLWEKFVHKFGAIIRISKLC